MSSTSAWEERWSDATSPRYITFRSPPPGVMPDHSYPTKMTQRPSAWKRSISRRSRCHSCSVTWKSLAWWHIMSSSATSRPKAKYSSMVPVPTVARVWPCRSPQKVLGSPGRTARIRLDAATWSPRAAVMRASAPAAVSVEAREPGRGQLAAPPRDARGKASDRCALGAEPDLAREPLAGIAPGVLGLDERVERLARSDCRGSHDDEPVEVAAHHVDHRRGVEHRVQLGAEGIHEEPEFTAPLAERLGARAGAAAAPVADGHVDAVAGIERAVGHRDHEALEPRPHLAARLEGERGHRRLARRLEPHRAVFGGARVGELRLAPVGGEARGDLDARPLVVAVGADLVA